jgi:cobalamin synthase
MPDSLPPETTGEQDRKTAGQRKINLVWEVTQALMALMVTSAAIYCAISGKESALLGNAFTLIIALYFVRTNHTKIGGIGGTDSR